MYSESYYKVYVSDLVTLIVSVQNLVSIPLAGSVHAYQEKIFVLYGHHIRS